MRRAGKGRAHLGGREPGPRVGWKSGGIHALGGDGVATPAVAHPGMRDSHPKGLELRGGSCGDCGPGRGYCDVAVVGVSTWPLMPRPLPCLDFQLQNCNALDVRVGAWLRGVIVVGVSCWVLSHAPFQVLICCALDVRVGAWLL